ncbi:carboxylate--amine ligase [Apilactobacillus micheneri]|uniref:Carboxylate--amine ligase n=1 Tax=Apilactobacillus micheneri TaxID=1899430 RepID=A0ABY2Z293_9LACO|nr:carboxylate--amine ligase [Apilactobacillus micheneri]TPR25432.1 carboxylate--amine ligase [Apilactobacillus micheneri]TPR26536.1 carboxylate--amine ligase [Apilactobacillus micheneri]TPR28323.1 carboxylate--amine ligase [Apilactobacillus micheneri]TPR29010.1 carboxylate--amine ligase [Apilactobacillus micheneri]TPR30599.1 carboxylate--amine ligase [Apilactobacillus micheneri]
MSNNTSNFTVVLLGSDFNAYGMARSLYEKYGKPVKAYAEKALAPTRYTKIVDLSLIDGFSEDPKWIEEMLKLKQKYSKHSEPVILIGCGDGYAELISKHKDELDDVFICPYVNYELIKKLNSKENFYKECEKFSLPYPKTRIISKSEYESDEDIEQPFGYPVALKPTNSVEWLDIHFEGRKKAFTIKSEAEFKDIVSKIYDNGYTSDLILQDFIPGDDSNMRTLNAYVDKNHKVKMMCLGHPLLEDPSPSSIGNYVAILPEYNEKLYSMVKTFLEEINFTGYANFDMKYDIRDNSFKLFEINLRQGRSSFFVSLNGYNLADWAVQDYAFDSLKDKDTVYANKDKSKYWLWLGVGKEVFKKYAKDNEDKEYAMKLINNHQYGTTFWYNKDRNFKRWMLVTWMKHIYAKNFQKYFTNK